MAKGIPLNEVKFLDDEPSSGGGIPLDQVQFVDDSAPVKPPAAPVPGIEAPEGPGALESAGRGALQGATFDFGDELLGLGKALFSADTWTGDDTGGRRFASRYKKGRDEEREANHAAQEAHPWAYGAGNLGGSVATSFIPGLGIAKGATALKAATGAAKLGALSGLGASESEDIGGQLYDAAKGGIVSGATTGILHKFIGGAPDRVVKRALGDITDGATATQRDRVVGKAGEKVADVFKEIRTTPAIRKAGSDAGKLLTGIEDSIQDVGAKLNGAYKSAGVRTEGIKVSDVLGEVEGIAKELGKDPGKRDLARAVQAKAEDVLESWGDKTHVPAQEVRTLASDIADAAFRGSPAVAPKAGQGASQQVWGRLKDLIDRNMDEAAAAGGTAGRTELKALNKRMSTLLNMREAVRYRATREATESTRLKDRISGGLDLGLALTSPTTFAAKKGYDYVGKPALRVLDERLASLVTAARAGSTKAQITQRALALGFRPVVAGAIATWVDSQAADLSGDAK